MPLIIPEEPWKPTTPGLTSTLKTRSKELLAQVASQFQVPTHPRYRPRPRLNDPTKFTTYCNIYVWDVTSAMGAEIPHWYDPASGDAVLVGKGSEMTANGISDWLETHGKSRGWKQASPKDAMLYATEGRLAIPVWKAPSGPGHVAVLLPYPPEFKIAQAGNLNFFNMPLESGFGKKAVRWYVHK